MKEADPALIAVIREDLEYVFYGQQLGRSESARELLAAIQKRLALSWDHAKPSS